MGEADRQYENIVNMKFSNTNRGNTKTFEFLMSVIIRYKTWIKSYIGTDRQTGKQMSIALQVRLK